MQKNYSFSCDIWSLGCILYELCTLNYLFNPSSDLFNFIHYNNLNINDKFPQCYSQNIKILIQKMLKKEPKERPNINKVLEYIIEIKNINLMINEILPIKNNKYINIKTEGDSPLKNNVKKINQNLKNNFKRKRYLSCKKENIENECDGREEEEEEEEKEEKKEEEEKWKNLPALWRASCLTRATGGSPSSALCRKGSRGAFPSRFLLPRRWSGRRFHFKATGSSIRASARSSRRPKSASTRRRASREFCAFWRPARSRASAPRWHSVSWRNSARTRWTSSSIRPIACWKCRVSARRRRKRYTIRTMSNPS